MWNEQKIEKYLEKILKKELGEDKGKEYYADYVSARTYVLENISPEIKAKEPDLSYHDASHIGNVLENVYLLLCDDGLSELSSIEIYCLCLIIVFHDVGNINGRKEHYDKRRIAEIYNKARNGASKYNQERFIVIMGASAHSGTSKSGSLDTIKEIDTAPTNLHGYSVRLRDIASIVRFADELAEGPQRTSDYKNKKRVYNEESKLHHQYAEQINVHIDRKGRRIALTYHIEIKPNETQEIDWDTIKDILLFTYYRIVKLDEERRYSKYYSELLSPFKKTEVLMKFYQEKIPCDIDIDKIIFEEEYVMPRSKDEINAEELYKKYPSLDIDNIIRSLQNSIS
jgi:hypothetical protein